MLRKSSDPEDRIAPPWKRRPRGTATGGDFSDGMGVNFGIRCVRAMGSSVPLPARGARRGNGGDGYLGIRHGKAGTHNRAGTCGRSTGDYEHVQIYIGDPGGRPITFLLPLARESARCVLHEGKFVRVCVYVCIRVRVCARIHDGRWFGIRSVYRTIMNRASEMERGEKRERKGINQRGDASRDISEHAERRCANERELA